MSNYADLQLVNQEIESNQKQPLVSVIIPTYNRSLYLEAAIKSAIQQTYQNIEIIVSDNCSPENPQAMIESFQDSRIKFWRNSSNIGMFANAMSAFEKAQGKYVASLNDDDAWNEDFLEKLVPILEANSNLSIAFCDHYIVDSDGKIDYSATETNTRFWKRNQLKEVIYQPFWEIGLVHKAVPTAMAAVVRKDAVDWSSIPSEVGNMWDLYVTYICCRSGSGAYYYPERLTRYRIHGQSDTMLSGRKDAQIKIRNAKAEIFCNHLFMEDERLQEFKPYFRQKWLHANTTAGIGLMRIGEVAEARHYFRFVLSQQKLNLRNIVAYILSFTPEWLAMRF